ncbi:M23 family metallopeptidase [Halobacillus massiliensis]|uniref:M23 family metallopeptidase n=1 Tax=Halobacillus massiliensis TaxID=1926286 RepID=UPI0009E40A5B|nr:M23 family metallopeptidase [Halobacillus massiliensis]
MIWIQAFIFIILPMILLLHLLKNVYPGRKLLIADWLGTGMFIAFLFFIGPWHIFIYYLRYVWVVLFIVTTFFVIKKVSRLPVKGPKNKSYKFSMGIAIFLTIYFGFVAVTGITGYFFTDKEKAIKLEFPMKDGVFSTGHGGADPSINYHNEYPPQQYAYDILQINGFGMRAAGLTPDDLEKYKIYGTPLYSPCSGEVLAAVDQYDDIPPSLSSDSKPEDPAGNHIILACKGAEVHIAHMKPGTVEVEKGDEMNTGDILGEVGNTGNTTEPHLHIHAEKDGVGVPITFNDRFLKRNSLVFN